MGEKLTFFGNFAPRLARSWYSDVPQKKPHPKKVAAFFFLSKHDQKSNVRIVIYVINSRFFIEAFARLNAMPSDSTELSYG